MSLKRITIEIKEDGTVSYNTEGLTGIEQIGLLTFYRDAVQIDILNQMKQNKTENNG